ncbi:hypothetical protein LX32DRAFT_646534 [Colletotrichum zoysiae]|uniref:Uncharacterized protein n=1 Tax=Colletotrichum zoysiae TaxID=1216348 RepID=A0AAD9LTI8_9PEZI|nr:hypothetical protein LX32DRAFT_646534 [Colletotrichum zoysiae]
MGRRIHAPKPGQRTGWEGGPRTSRMTAVNAPSLPSPRFTNGEGFLPPAPAP